MEPDQRPYVFLGDLALDVLVRRATAIQAGTDTPASIMIQSGGSAANVAAWYAHACQDTTLSNRTDTTRTDTTRTDTADHACVFIGCVGHDPAGTALVAELVTAGVTPHVTIVDGCSTACIVIMVGPDGERDMISDRGAGLHLSLTSEHCQTLSGCAGLHLTLYSFVNSVTRDSALQAAHIARSTGALLSLDLSSLTVMHQIGVLGVRDLIATIRPDVVLANRAECDIVFPGGYASDLLPPLLVIHDRQGVTISQSGAKELWVPAVTVAPKRVRDTTGAGDALAAGLIRGLRSGLAASEAAQYAVQLAAQAVQVWGGRPRPVDRDKEEYQEAKR